ncbi:hypothetical protein [Streptomyces sp. NPDC091215]|uniref:hypothetical protein n=1 Tax=Streptomyces sp. NPDC091215 TaxID=3155192 RepID=UPI00341A779A
MTRVLAPEELLSVTLDPELDTPHTHAALAGLPEWFSTGAGEPAAVHAIGGPGWTTRLGTVLGLRPRAVLLGSVAPAPPETVRALAELADRNGVPVIVDSPWALHPTTAELAPHLRKAAAGAAQIELFTAADTPPLRALVDQLALAAVTVGQVTELRLHRLDDHGHVATARCVGVPVSFSGAGTGSGAHEARLVVRGAGEQWRLGFGDPHCARPVAAVRIDDTGEHSHPTHYETAHRAAWGHTHAAAVHGTTPVYGLRELAAQLALLPDTVHFS